LKSNIGKTAHLKDKVTIAQEETIPNIWNGTMFGDLDWPQKASHGFVSMSWASCYIWSVWLEIAYSRQFLGSFALRCDGVPLELGTSARGQKTRVLGLPDGRKSFKIHLAV